jgi:uncharacterized membrane protein
VIMGGFLAGAVLILLWELLPKGLNFTLLFSLPVAGALSGYYLSGKARKNLAV